MATCLSPFWAFFLAMTVCLAIDYVFSIWLSLFVCLTIILAIDYLILAKVYCFVYLTACMSFWLLNMYVLSYLTTFFRAIWLFLLSSWLSFRLTGYLTIFVYLFVYLTICLATDYIFGYLTTFVYLLSSIWLSFGYLFGCWLISFCYWPAILLAIWLFLSFFLSIWRWKDGQ